MSLVIPATDEGVNCGYETFVELGGGVPKSYATRSVCLFRADRASYITHPTGTAAIEEEEEAISSRDLISTLLSPL
jgi:hypothetical protein